MSSISVSGVGLQSFFQNIQNGTSAPQVDASDATADPSSSGDASPPKVHHGHHHHGGGGGQFFSKIQGAVTSALQSAQSDPSADPNKVIEDAIAKVFAGGNSSDSSDASNSSNTASSPTDGTAPASTIAAPGSPQQFFDTLKSLGVDPQQFHQDFLNAIHDAKNGKSNAGAAFASFPPGSNIDTTA